MPKDYPTAPPKTAENQIWAVATGKELPSKIADPDGHFFFGMACSPDGRILALAGSGQTIDLWDLVAQTKIGSLKGHLHEIWTLAFTADGQSLVSASLDGTAKLWRPEPKTEINTLTRSALDVRLTLDGKSLLVMATNGTIQQWDTHTRQMIETFDVPLPRISIRAQTLSSDGELAAFALADGTMRIWNLRTKNWNQTLTNQWGRAYAIEFSPRLPILAAACSRTNINGARQYTVELWDLASTPAMTPYGELRTDSWNNKLTFSANGERLVVIGTDNSVQIIDIGQQKARTVIPKLKGGSTSMALSPDQLQLATAGDNEIRLWDLKSGQNTHVLLGHRQNVVCVTFSADGRTLASAAETGAIKLWSVGTGKELLTIHGLEDNQDAVAFSADGNLIAGLGRRTGRGSVSLLRVPSLAEIDAALNLPRTGSSK